MSYFDPDKDIEIIVDGSPVGIGAILTQLTVNADGSETSNVVSYAYTYRYRKKLFTNRTRSSRHSLGM